MINNTTFRKKSILVIKSKDVLNYIELVILFFVLHTNGFLKYVVFFVWFLLYLLIKKEQVRIRQLSIMIPAIVCVSIGVVLSFFQPFSFVMIKEIVFHLLPPMGAIAIWNAKAKENENYISIMFLSELTVYLFTTVGSFSNADWLESQYAFVMGIFVLYYFYVGNKFFFVLSLIAFLLGHKRITWPGVAIGLLVLLVAHLVIQEKNKRSLSTKKDRRLQWSVSIYRIVLLVLLFMWVYICSTNDVALFFRKYHINSQGRVDYWIRLADLYRISVFYVGRGLGYVTSLIERWNISSYGLFHNDVLLMYIQLGFFGFSAYFLSYFDAVKLFIRKYHLSTKASLFYCVLISYTFICLLTDNISVYINYLFPYYIISLKLLSKESDFDLMLESTKKRLNNFSN